MSKYEVAVFDVDGTLLDTTEGVVAAVKHTIELKGLKALSNDELVTFIGPPIQDSFARVYGLEGEVLQELATIFRDFYKGPDLLKAKPYEGIYQLCDELVKKGVKIAVATYKREDYALDILKHFGFDRYTKVMYGADHENKLKKVDIIEKCLKALGVTEYKKAIMIGDSWHDANGAQQIGIDFAGVTYGFGYKSKKDVEKGYSVGAADSPIELMKFFG